MKKLFILFLLAVSATVNATTVADNDTLTILKPQKVRIITGDSIQKVKVYGRENDDKYTYESKILSRNILEDKVILLSCIAYLLVLP